MQRHKEIKSTSISPSRKPVSRQQNARMAKSPMTMNVVKTRQRTMTQNTRVKP